MLQLCDKLAALESAGTFVKLTPLQPKIAASGGKPTGFKLCIGHPWEFLAVVKAMLKTGITPDFIVVDGKEGGTGAAPLEFMDHLGMPMREGLTFVHSALIGTNLRDRIKLGAAGKIVSGFDMARVMALGADWCNAARGFMFAVGCLQSQQCHTDRCPTGVATQDRLRQRAVVISDKSLRVAHFHRETVIALAELIAAPTIRASFALTTSCAAPGQTASSASPSSTASWSQASSSPARPTRASKKPGRLPRPRALRRKAPRGRATSCSPPSEPGPRDPCATLIPVKAPSRQAPTLVTGPRN